MVVRILPVSLKHNGRELKHKNREPTQTKKLFSVLKNRLTKSIILILNFLINIFILHIQQFFSKILT